jgi:hypothetical protein
LVFGAGIRKKHSLLQKERSAEQGLQKEKAQILFSITVFQLFRNSI